jgi:hypothetical protein
MFLFGNEFLELKKRKSPKIGSKLCFLQMGRHGYQNIRNFTLISKWGFLPLYLALIKR